MRDFHWDKRVQSATDYRTWTVIRTPRRGVSIEEHRIPQLPLEQSRLLLIAANELRVVDPCPPDWFNADADDLLERSEPL